MVWFWFIVLLIMILLEISTVNLVSIWFAIGAFVSCILAYFNDNYILQIIVFLLVSIIMLLLIKPFTKKIKKSPKVATNLDRVIGMEGIVTEEISKNKIGEVKVDGKKWSAISTQTIEKGTVVKIDEIDGVKLIVKKED
ncbi:MAG: NfeD family protein [Bacilli bacterium]|nr:NfeD family protein [Bacilli bacterium]